MTSKLTDNLAVERGNRFPVSPLAARIFAIAGDAGCEARIVGGAVRDWLMGQSIGDIDMAIAMPITAAIPVFQAAGLKVIETGISHGTVTIIDGGEHIEVTQTRIDVETDGRHAQVVFSEDWAADAVRRDLTINALYLTADGIIDDPLNGRQDIVDGRVRFAGDAGARVQEDALRMLRFCRFVAHFASNGNQTDVVLDSDAMAALRAHAGLAQTLSGERIAAECSKICKWANAPIGFAVMQDTGVALAALGHPLCVDHADCLVSLHAAGIGADPASDDWIIWLAAMTAPDVSPAVADRLCLSRKQRQLLLAVARDDPLFDAISGPQWRQAAWMMARNRGNAAASYAVGAARRRQMVDAEHYVALRDWEPPLCPVTGADLLSHGVDNGPALGQLLGAIEARWVESDFTLAKAALLAELSAN